MKDKVKSILAFIGLISIVFFTVVLLSGSIVISNNGKEVFNSNPEVEGRVLFGEGYKRGVECRGMMSAPSCYLILEKTK